MFNIIIATHGHLAKEFLRVLQSFFGETPQIEAINLGDNGISIFSKQVDQLIKPILTEPTIIFCDIAGGTPFNEFAQKTTCWQSECVLFGGVSLPVLVETLNLRMQNIPFAEVVRRIQKLPLLTKFAPGQVKDSDDE
ncbi:hypothetical protein PT285_07455 [Lactobacillus sp. ESL0791]|uniref:PTS sugar transporter subunit IIA n=1 Tax=Lactobacillus sp. ESL0791 TaxID=2983234 RepID=UPI0023F9286A|nr:hypothetical protein [Lactobacillus sp. ESL0791]MDF7639235.1 hypothetical protein [Lactobacillus sp. ESL0791]